MKNIIGLNLWSHDTSACLIQDKTLLGAIEQERLNGKKHTKDFPIDAINLLLSENNLSINEIDEIAIGWNFDCFIQSQYLLPATTDINEITYLIRDIKKISDFHNTEKLIRDKLNYWKKISFHDHHLAHAAFAYACAIDQNTTSLVIDGFGDKSTTTIYNSTSSKDHTKIWDANYPNSIGLVYSAITKFLGFRENCDEGIIMGLAAYGNANLPAPRSNKSYIELFRSWITLTNELQPRLSVNTNYFPFGNARVGLFSENLTNIFGVPRVPEGDLTDHHMNIAAALQLRLEEISLLLVQYAHSISPNKCLTISGGVALNCVNNAVILEKSNYQSVIVPPSPGDGGVSIGAALLASDYSIKFNQDSLIGLGPTYSETAILDALNQSKFKFTKPENLYKDVAKLLADGNIIGWFQDGSEFGPRALGNRSILTAPFPAEMKDTLNSRVKFREWFRPFAPIVLEEFSHLYFDTLCYTPYMMHAFKAHQNMQEKIAATVHVDGTARVQTVSRNGRPKLATLLDEFHNITGVHVILNTSFNVKGQAIVETPKQAVETFESTNLDALVIGKYLMIKSRTNH